MGSIKKDLRDKIKNLKEQYNNTRDRHYILEAAVTKGVYQSLGGNMAISLPLFCNNIVEVSKSMTRARGKLTGDIASDVEKLAFELRKDIDYVVSIDYVQDENGNNKVQLITSQLPYDLTFDTESKLSDTVLAGIMEQLIIIASGSEDARFSRKEYNTIKESFINLMQITDGMR